MMGWWHTEEVVQLPPSFNRCGLCQGEKAGKWQWQEREEEEVVLLQFVLLAQCTCLSRTGEKGNKKQQLGECGFFPYLLPMPLSETGGGEQVGVDMKKRGSNWRRQPQFIHRPPVVLL